MRNVIRDITECCRAEIKGEKQFPIICPSCDRKTRMVKEVRCSCGRKHVTSSKGDSRCTCGTEFNALGDELVSRHLWEEPIDEDSYY